MENETDLINFLNYDHVYLLNIHEQINDTINAIELDFQKWYNLVQIFSI